MSTSRPLVLYAEDDKLTQQLFGIAMKNNSPSFEIHFLNDGQELFDYLDQTKIAPDSFRRPSVILVDIKMPRVNGMQALREIKANPDFVQIPVIVFSSVNRKEIIDECIELGAVTHLEKPLRVEGYSTIIHLVETICLLETDE